MLDCFRLQMISCFLYIDRQLQGMLNAFVINKQFVLNRRKLLEYFFEICSFQSAWEYYFKNVLELLVGNIAILGWVKLSKQVVIVLHEIHVGIDAVIVVLHLLKPTDLS